MKYLALTLALLGVFAVAANAADKTNKPVVTEAAVVDSAPADADAKPAADKAE